MLVLVLLLFMPCRNMVRRVLKKDKKNRLTGIAKAIA